jgi:hypothetical protein
VSPTPDPTDAKADGAFGNHRVGYSPYKLEQAMYWGRKGGTLHTGEGALLVQEIERLRALVRELGGDPR